MQIETTKGAECINGKYYVLLKDFLINKNIIFDRDGPTGKNIVNCFSGANPSKRDLAEKQLGLLSNLDKENKANNVLMKLERFTVRDPLYYLNSKCYERERSNIFFPFCSLAFCVEEKNFLFVLKFLLLLI